MKFFAIAIILTFTAFISATLSLSAQSTVIGHASAEIVEAVSVSSNTITNITINNIPSSAQANLNLGNMTVKSGNSVNCEVVIKPATVSSENGTSFTVNPTTESEYISKANPAYGNRTLAIRGSVDLSHNPVSGEYKGSYSVVFAYN